MGPRETLAMPPIGSLLLRRLPLIPADSAIRGSHVSVVLFLSLSAGSSQLCKNWSKALTLLVPNILWFYLPWSAARQSLLFHLHSRTFCWLQADTSNFWVTIEPKISMSKTEIIVFPVNLAHEFEYKLNTYVHIQKCIHICIHVIEHLFDTSYMLWAFYICIPHLIADFMK